MFSSDQLWVMMFGVILGLGFIVFIMYAANKLFNDQTQDVLVRFILLVFAALVGIFVVDKIVAFKIKLITDEQNKELFDLIKTLILMIFSYYFGSQKNTLSNNSSKKEGNSQESKCEKNCDCKK
jgi:Kef-type K+ transport system membrane component KefB